MDTTDRITYANVRGFYISLNSIHSASNPYTSILYRKLQNGYQNQNRGCWVTFKNIYISIYIPRKHGVVQYHIRISGTASFCIKNYGSMVDKVIISKTCRKVSMPGNLPGNPNSFDYRRRMVLQAGYFPLKRLIFLCHDDVQAELVNFCFFWVV